MIKEVRDELIAANRCLADLSAHIDTRGREAWQQQVWQRFRRVVVDVWWAGVATGMIVDQRDGMLVPVSPPAAQVDDDVRVKISEALTALYDTLAAYPDDRKPL